MQDLGFRVWGFRFRVQGPVLSMTCDSTWHDVCTGAMTQLARMRSRDGIEGAGGLGWTLRISWIKRRFSEIGTSGFSTNKTVRARFWP